MATLNKPFLKTIAPNAKPEILEGIVSSLSHLSVSGISEPLVIAHFLAQIAHESGGFRHVVEVWGPTPAQTRYDTRIDLGNTAALDNDGYLYRGRGLIQLTGKANYTRFNTWVHLHFPTAPDFVKNPQRVADFPWAFLTASWFWQVNGLTLLAAIPANDAVEKITKKINGGYNGLADRRTYFDVICLQMLDYGPNDEGIRAFQASATLTVDGDLGPKTRYALQKAVAKLASKQEVVTTAESIARTIDEPGWKPKPVDFVSNVISYIFWALGNLLKFKLSGKL